VYGHPDSIAKLHFPRPSCIIFASVINAVWSSQELLPD